MSSISITKLYDLLTAKVGRDTAENLTTFIEEKIKVELESQTSILATKADIHALNLATKEEIHALRMGTNNEFGKVRQEISETKAELLKWMFIFWVGQVATTFGLIMLFLKK
jgi:hypothetical protein